MTEFHIIQSKPDKYKTEICSFWQQNLPGTPPDRIDWLQNNPAGSSIWMLAFDAEKQKLIGTVSIMPRKMSINGKYILAGVVGDFMVDSQYRVFGPAFAMQKMVLDKIENLGFDFVYTVPNQASLKMTKRVGYNDSLKLISFVKPIRCKPYLSKLVNNKISTILGFVLDVTLKVVSLETYLISKGYYKEVKEADRSFDYFWAKLRKIYPNLMGDYSKEFIDWKYFDNPQLEFRVISYRNKPEDEMLGYVVFSINDQKMYIYNILYLSKNIGERLLCKLIKLARKENCQSIYIRLSEYSPFKSTIKKFLFVNAKEEIEVYSCGMKYEELYGWSYSDGDRNL